MHCMDVLMATALASSGLLVLASRTMEKAAVIVRRLRAAGLAAAVQDACVRCAALEDIQELIRVRLTRGDSTSLLQIACQTGCA